MLYVLAPHSIRSFECIVTYQRDFAYLRRVRVLNQGKMWRKFLGSLGTWLVFGVPTTKNPDLLYIAVESKTTLILVPFYIPRKREDKLGILKCQLAIVQ